MSFISGTIGPMLAANAQENAAETSAQATKDAAAQQAAVQREMYYRGLAEYQPFREAGLSALPMYQSAILGGPVKYADPRYTRMSPEEVKNAKTQVPLNITPANNAAIGNYMLPPDVSLSQIQALVGRPGAGDGTVSESTYKYYDPNKTWYRGPNGEIVETPPMLEANYDYKASPTLAPQVKMYNRGLASRGLSGSGQAASGLADIAANDYYKQLSLLGGLVDVGRGASTSTAQASQSLGNNLSNIYGGVGDSNSLSALMAGQAKAGLYSGLGNIGSNLAQNAYRGYNAYNAYQADGLGGALKSWFTAA